MSKSSQSEETFVILAVFHVRTIETNKISQSEERKSEEKDKDKDKLKQKHNNNNLFF